LYLHSLPKNSEGEYSKIRRHLNEIDRMKGDFKGFLELKKPFTLLSTLFQAALTTSG